MEVYQEEISIETHELKISDISQEVQTIVRKSNIVQGTVHVFNVGSTAVISTIEYEPGLLKDFPAMIQKIIPKGIPYEHDKTWGDNNGHSHLRATFMGPSLTVPIRDAQLLTGTWQQIVHIEFDHRPRNRSIIVTIQGKK
jgi:secondary thiamine-phosphate synthase enzyme